MDKGRYPGRSSMKRSRRFMGALAVGSRSSCSPLSFLSSGGAETSAEVTERDVIGQACLDFQMNEWTPCASRKNAGAEG